MLVHRKNDDQSGGEKPETGSAAPDGKMAPPQPGGEGPLSDPALPDSIGDDDIAPSDDGKTHMIGDALKSVYQRTLEEDIPDDFLDLLKQLK